MRSLALLILAAATMLGPPAARAGDDHAAKGDGHDDDEPALISAEVRAGYGVAVGGGAGRASVRGAPLVLGARVAFAVRDQPRLSGYGGIIVETLDRTGVGGDGGIVVEPRPRLRLRAGAVAMVAPYHLYGGEVGGGRCLRGATRICLDVDADVFVGGSDLPSGGAAMQLLVGLGIGFDAE
ncbi:MAG TPA: hypothetical protein VHE35_10210 [Kofleriaceae bacterium]|nr:hypothetical protein [Kofleriaceae bacterium]